MAAGALVLAGCNTVVLHPAGDIAAQQGRLVIIATLLMLIIIIPVIVLTLVFAWRYRQSNDKAEYNPEWHHSTKLELVIWSVPLMIIIALGSITWIATHKLDPYRPLDRIAEGKPLPENVRPLEVQVVSLDWKWLFVLPEQGIATVNELAAPVDRPIHFTFTSSTTMNAFYVPDLAGMIYTMPGMTTELNAVINKPGEFKGISAHYSGAGFAGMHFRFLGVSDADFDKWVAEARAGKALDRNAYIELAKPSERNPVERFASVEDGLFKRVVNLCVEESKPCMHDVMAADAARGRAAAKARQEALTTVMAQSICTSSSPVETLLN
ncbi:ubiquinol oxidase subunit II [Xylophilus sp.]|uniref:ubiquinol oxidase subunit II n=1 Tax=Xylophilus sp. TaxID=2653893 RepID=UPI0013BE41D2|nr:ubiquinol oxidase subunit II [Xylophilus sp.]KAF1047812.1 MAG: Cytochrome bo(3) ubiquinol oxidase subunit 2 [Xylophilus sp.]